MGKSTYPKYMDQVARISAETAVQAAMDYLEKQEKERKRQRVDRRLRNTKLLLVNYRGFKLHYQDLKDEIGILVDVDLLDDLDSEEHLVESIKKSKQRTLAMVNFIDRMLVVYKAVCEASDKFDEKRKYQTIEKLYISEEKFTPEMVAECHKTDVRTVYRDVKDAVKTLSVLIFGVDGIRFEE